MKYNYGMEEVKRKRTYGAVKRAVGFVRQGFGQLIWPGVCNDCGAAVCDADGGLCEKCWDELLSCTVGDYCPRCGRNVSKYAIVQGSCPDCQGRQIDFDGISRVGIYENILRRMILAFKNNRTEVGVVLAPLASGALQGSPFCRRIDLLVPVPLHWSRRLVRGYNQSFVMAKKLKHPTAQISTDLVRIRRTKSQTAVVSPAARTRNVAGAFAVRDGHGFAGRTICLVDDIKTTGATLNECARTLKETGASRVFALVLAVAGQDAG